MGKDDILKEYEKIKGCSSDLFDNEEWSEFNNFVKGYEFADIKIKERDDSILELQKDINHLKNINESQAIRLKMFLESDIDDLNEKIKDYDKKEKDDKIIINGLETIVGNLANEAKVYRNRISELESKVNELGKPDLSLYNSNFLNWLDKYFTKSIKILRYKSKTQSNKRYTLQELEQKFNKAYKENPYNKDI